MVTYFPVPYVAYSKINASKQLDIGLTSACEMNLGCSESGALGIRPLQATTVNLNRGKLDLNTASAVKSTNVALGSGSGEANIDFATNLRIGTLNNGYSLEATDMTVDELKLFASHMRAGGEKFPSCAATGASGSPQVSWQKVKLKKAEEVYLVCGTPTETNEDPCLDESYKRMNKSQCCQGVSQTDNICYTDCPPTYQWQPYVEYGSSYGDYFSGVESIVEDSPRLQQWFGAADWLEKACKYNNWQELHNITCNGTLLHDCWNPHVLNPSFTLVLRSWSNNVNTAQPESFLGSCSRDGQRGLLLVGNTYTGYTAEEIMCQYNWSRYRLYATAYYYECRNQTSGRRCKNGW